MIIIFIKSNDYYYHYVASIPHHRSLANSYPDSITQVRLSLTAPIYLHHKIIHYSAIRLLNKKKGFSILRAEKEKETKLADCIPSLDFSRHPSVMLESGVEILELKAGEKFRCLSS